MRILIINNGSTSFRYSVFDTQSSVFIAKGSIENLGTNACYCKYDTSQNKLKMKCNIKNCNDAIEMMNDLLFDKNVGVIQCFEDISAVGYRVIHGGEFFQDSCIIDDDVVEKIKKNSVLMPLHGSKILTSIDVCSHLYNHASNIAVFDTAFHTTIPKENYLYALPIEYYEKYGIRKYGAHGISYNYVVDRFSDITQQKKEDIHTIICHMGGGCSMCSIKNGKSFDTTMGFTPVSGLIMASRCGNIDPSIVTYLINELGMSCEEVIKLLNEDSGYLGICLEKDAKAIVDSSLRGDEKSILLRNMANMDFKKNLLSMMSTNKVTSIIITGGMGTKNKEQRELFLSDLENFNIKLDREKNNRVFDEEAIISMDSGNYLPIYVIPDDEEKQIAKECIKVLRR